MRHLSLSEVLCGTLRGTVIVWFGLHDSSFHLFHRLRVVSNFGDGDCGAGKIHARAKVRGDATQRERQKLETSDKAN